MGKFLVNLIIDESGSMAGQKNDVIGGVNDYINGLRADVENEYRVSLTLFDTSQNITVRIGEPIPISRFPALTAASYAPRGGTPLYDAIGNVMAASRPNEAEDVLFVIFTDGEENSSREWNIETVRKVILEHEARGETFLYLGQGLEAWAGGNRIFQGTQSGLNVVKADSFAAAAMMSTNSTQAYTTGYRTGTRTIVDPPTVQ